MSPMRNPSEFIVQELREKLKALGLNTTGPKNELISRLMEADPAGNWLCVSGDVQDGSSCNGQQGSDACEMPAMSISAAEVSRREMEVMKEKERLERKLAIARREIESLRERRRFETTETSQTGVQRVTDSTVTTETIMQASEITAIAELLGYFDGASDSCET